MDSGTITNPSPADTRLMIVWDCATSCAIVSEKPPLRQNWITSSYNAGAMDLGNMTNCSDASRRTEIGAVDRASACTAGMATIILSRQTR